MAIRFNKAEAKDYLRSQARIASTSTSSASWIKKVEKLSKLCEEGISKTHIAFLGTALLAKALNAKVDLYKIKPTHAKDTPNAFSARSLCHSVFVPVAAELGISLGVSGREPLNNQPYFRMSFLGDNTPVHPGGKDAFDFMLVLIGEMDKLRHDTVEKALRSFILVRRKFIPTYSARDKAATVSTNNLIAAIEQFVKDDSEGGRRAQAVAAGLLDAFAGPDSVVSGRINDPSRKHPGDVCVVGPKTKKIQKAFEVRDKPVKIADIQIFGKKCLEMGVFSASVLMVNDRQQVIDQTKVSDWAEEFGLGMTLYQGWPGFCNQVLFWSPAPKVKAAQIAVQRIYDRLIEVEVTPKSIDTWQKILGQLKKNPSVVPV